MTTKLFQAVLCLGLVSYSIAADCTVNTCTAEQVCYQADPAAPEICLDEGYRPGNCSHNVVHCHDHARCDNSADQLSYTCNCVGDAISGDGFRDGTGCQLPYKPCTDNKDCPQYGFCDSELNVCECKPGFQGDGHTCTDIEECAEVPSRCDPYAKCSNYPGGFTCQCDINRGYVGDGFTCRLFCHSHNDCDWPKARCNAENNCECITGYVGDGMVCQDIDECALGLDDCNENATCANADGSYTCTCNNGFSGDGKTCTPLPRKCDEIPKRKNKRMYLIDPDFQGPANAFLVQCIYLGNKRWATTVIPKGNFPVAAPEIDAPLEIEYEPSTDDIKALVNNSAFCSQKFSFSCTPGYSLFPGLTWYDANQNAHNNWGSSIDGMCTCGELKLCPSSCYCDGTQVDESTTDEARVVDKTKLPLVSIVFGQGQRDKGRVDVEPMMCSSAPIDIPKDCHEAKFVYGYEEDTPMFINLGGEEPFLVFCDMESYEHVGITQIPTNNGNPVDVTTVDGETITYTQNHDKIKALISGSVFCSQRVEFQCTNSRIGGADGAAVFVRGEMQKLDYFPGAAGKSDSCACGATGLCDGQEVKCNCNIDDGQARKDFGLIVDKSSLPVTKVTAQVGPTKSSTYEIGELKCSQKQFGIEPNCDKYHAIGERESYTYFIDPDGTGGQDPFPVECLFVQEPAQGKTIVHHDNEGNVTVDSTDLTITYLMASPGQIEALLDRSTFCTQEIALDCKKFTVPVDPGTIYWTGSGSAPTGTLKLSDYLDSCGPNGDACQCSAQGKDTGTITDKAVLPLNKLDFSSLSGGFSTGGSVKVEVGPLVCSEVFPTCKQLYDFVNSDAALEGEATVVTGLFTTDPDGAGGVDPFTVECTFPDTTIETDGKGKVGPKPDSPLKPVSKCFDISYTSGTGRSLTPAQVAAYAAASTSCSQSLSLKCKKAPASKMVNFTTCDGKTQVGWAGSYGQDSCACGVNGNCDGGREALCNCDKAGNKEREDAGTITQMDRLPVCQVCLSIDPPANGKPWPSPTPQLSFTIGELVCDRPKNGIGSCQQARRGQKVRRQIEEGMRALDVGGADPIPVGCKLHRDPPLGVLTVKPEDPVFPPKEGEPTNITINYLTINITLVGQVISEQKFCSQKIFLYCAEEGSGNLTGGNAWYGRDGSKNYDWTRLPDDGHDVEHNCENNAKYCNLCGNPQGYLITRKDLLPVTRLVLAGTGIGVVVENTECFDLLSSCQEIYDTKQRQTGYFGKNRYIIDVDKAGPLRPFRVLCEFDKTTDNAVTVVEVGGEWESTVPIVGQDDVSEDFDLDVEYEHASPDQINGLAKISGFCWQGVQFKCQHFPLLVDPTQPSTYYRLYDGEPASSFGTAEAVDFQGCACHLLGTCSTAMTCNCDAEGPMGTDQGAVTNKASLPITGVFVSGRNDSESVAQLTLGAVRCSARSTALPKDCAEAYELKKKDGVDYRESGEFLISPNPDVVEPFMVRCDFTTFPKTGVTVIVPHFPENNPLPTNESDTPTDIPYNGVTKEQIQALVGQSAYCYQGVRFDCYHTALLSGNSNFMSTDMDKTWNFWGGGKPGKNGQTGTCACGDDDACAGLDSSQGQRTRPCNCDLLDDEFRRDAGIIDVKEALPITKFNLGAVTNNSQASLTVGDLYCSQEPLNIDECALNFHDCDPMAACEDMEDGYHCVCPEGWQGKGVVTDSSHALANGRVCIDDDECESLNPCEYNADCHNLPGTFNCTCKEGFRAISKTECEDVDECAEETDDCGENAFCENLVGSYRCMCNKGFRGDGKECTPVGQCSCFGDPHCRSFDERWIHYQGDCHYVMATDGCDGRQPTFTVQVEMWRKGQSARAFPYSWVKSVRVLVGDKDIRMEQGPMLVVNGQVTQQYIDSFRLRVVQINQRIKLTTFSGLDITWDGSDRVSVTVPSGARDNTCGLCGNYDGNPDNDWTVGPACPELAGNQTDNYDLFGRSWVVEDQCTADCSETEPPPPTEECESENKADAVAACNSLLDKQTSVFKKCLEEKDPDYIKTLQFACVFDLCASSEELDVKVCRAAKTIATECINVDKIQGLANWRDSVEECPDMTCPNNMVYSSCGRADPPTCFNKDDKPMVLDVQSCDEGCFCPDGWLTEGDKCIKEEQCGCYHENSYIPTGERVILADCSAEIQCEGLNQTTSSPVECGVYEECRSDNGVTACYCDEGYVDVNGTCEDDSCVGVVCAENMECENGTCVCINGFHGECGICVDIDECETHQHDCLGRGQKCVNELGGYRCDCVPGYTRDGKRCKDVNECEVLTNACEDYSECVNTMGGYVCECCAGYKHADNGMCVRDQSQNKASGGRCCACQGEMCTKPGKVCGSDGNTYASYRAFARHACKTEDDDLVFNYNGECQDSCDDIVCTRNYQRCSRNSNGILQCKCPNCKNSDNTTPVCGSNGMTYPGVCSLKKAACNDDYQDMVEVKGQGPCQGDGQS